MEIHSNDILSHWAVEQKDLKTTSLQGKIQPESMLLKDPGKLL